ncbi:chromate efflux transporter [Tunicatimonas pelagia]|uniref:chromate efflux transporter n=1 Tax=Tunicatimonas pelagia TaxID=931531 RepID=UPI002666EB69|nr:chromate efflux transporter [Tunicatimonas pelagia]WKN40691.1 chromate efflux transporter [Tunicatimonas pelagia]
MEQHRHRPWYSQGVITSIRRVRYFIFLRDVFILTISAFGGPQAHLTLLLKMMVEKRRYLSEKDLMELYALCQILPGPSSTQTITGIGYRIGGPKLAFLTLLVWMLPAVSLMTVAAIVLSNIQEKELSLEFTRFIQPMAVGFVFYAAYTLSVKVVNTRSGIIIMIAATIISFLIRKPFIYPLLLLLAGVVTALKYRKHPREEKGKLSVRWGNLTLWISILVVAAITAGITQAVPIRIFENFYRNGSLIFGGGQVLIPLLYTEFVNFKQYLTSEEFLTGYALVQAIPGPVFSFSAFIGSLAMRDYGVGGEVLGAFVASLGIFLPGTFLIFFMLRFWDNLKKYRVIKASLEGIVAASAGMVIAAALLLLEPLELSYLNIGIVVGTALLLQFTRIPAPIIILAGLLAGILF